ncbi:MAG: hypothetical protein ABIJ92_04310 [Candidatus Aenigmatarchaeota archaeon]
MNYKLTLMIIGILLVLSMSLVQASGRFALVDIRSSDVIKHQATTSAQKESIYRDTLGIEEAVPVSAGSVEAFVVQKASDSATVEKAATITKMVKSLYRERIANDLLAMDASFVRKFAVEAENEAIKPELVARVESYKNDLENKAQIRVQIEKNDVKELFQKKITMNQLIQRLWNSV